MINVEMAVARIAAETERPSESLKEPLSIFDAMTNWLAENQPL